MNPMVTENQWNPAVPADCPEQQWMERNLLQMIEQLREEHEDLREQLLEIYGTARVIGQQEDVINWIGSLRDLRKKLNRFMSELERHAEWEHHGLFPALADTFGGSRGDLLAIESKHEQAKLYVSAYNDAMERFASPIRKEEACGMVQYLLLAYEALKDHFDREERYIDTVVRAAR